MARESPWRQQARAVIGATLAALPAGADCRAALRAAYPFGVREHHPYKIWCSEVRRALGVRPGQWAIRPTGLFITLLGGLSVSCEYCSGLIVGGCGACVEHHQRMQQLLTEELFIELWRSSARGDALARLVLADWLEEHGHADLAVSVRHDPWGSEEREEGAR